MAKKSILNPQNLVDQARSGDFEGFTLNLSSSRFDESFEDFIQNGRLGGIDLSSYYESLGGSGSTVNNFLENTRTAVVANGRKLFETSFTEVDFRFGGSMGRFEIDGPEREIFDTSKFEDIHTIQDLANAVDVSKISFKPVQETVNRVETKPVESMPDMLQTQNNSMVPNLNLKTGGLILAAGVLGLALLRGES